MSNWLNFNTVQRWAIDNAGATDCTKACAKCKKTWHQIKLEGRGEEMIHMMSVEKKTPCGMNIEIVCNTCYEAK